MNTVFQTQSFDATTLGFRFSVSDPAATSISVDLVFGSEEYPEWVDAFVDCGVLIVDGVNYALFNKDPNAPLSVISPNLAAGYFQDNANGFLPIEYDGVSAHLRIVAPLTATSSTHTIKIGIADTGDHILDSGLFLANLSAGNDPGSGVVADPGGGTPGDDHCSGSSQDEYFNLQAGDDTLYSAGGADIIVAGSGNDLVYGGSGNDQMQGQSGDDWLDGGADLDTAVYSGASSGYALSLQGGSVQISLNGTSQGEGLDTLVGIEQLQFSDGLFSLAIASGAATLLPVLVPPPPASNTAGVLVISGLAAVGHTLSGYLSDVDGLPPSAAISWQWSRDGVAMDGATGATYQVQADDLGAQLMLEASYSDAKGNLEMPISNSLLIQPPSDGDLTVTLMAIEGPAIAAVHTPITTLLQRAVELGESPNNALQKIRSALKVPVAIGSLLSTNAFQILQSGSGDTAAALALAKLEVQVAILCSLSDDQQGLKISLSLLEKAAAGGSVDLSKAADVALILGLDTSTFNLADKNTYPQPLREIIDRNNNIRDAGRLLDSSPGSGGSIENEWLDFLSNWDSLADSVPLSTLSLAINQAPSGIATASLPDLVAGEAYALSQEQLSSGFHDPDNDGLMALDLSTDHGAWFSLAADGSWFLDSSAADYDASYRGPLELSYTIDDGQGHSVAASQLLLVVDHANQAPTGAVTLAVVGGGPLAQNATLQASQTLSDADQIATAITYRWYAGSTLVGQGSSVLLSQAQVGQSLHVEASYTDGAGKLESVSSAATAAVANVDDAPSGGVTLMGGDPPLVEATLTATQTVSDLDGIPSSGAGAIRFQWQSSADGYSWSDIPAATAASLLVGSSLAGRILRAEARYTDLFGTATTVRSPVSSPAVLVWSGTAANDTRSGSSWHDTLNGAAGNDKLSGLAGHDRLEGGSGIDTLIGGQGDDLYLVDHASDLITELAGEGLDTVQASVTYSLLSKGANVEALVLSGSAAINATGNGLANTLTGNSAANLLDGGAGNDTMSGGLGDDTYTVDSSGDRVQEAPGGGNDRVQTALSYSLAGLAEVEGLILTGSAAINGSGNSLANTLVGNSGANLLQGAAGADSLSGGSGADTLCGSQGQDTLTGGLGADRFRFDTALETGSSAVAD
ncbi:MAG: choice-of-anchor L domain-containing protein [Cyanobium sp.]